MHAIAKPRQEGAKEAVVDNAAVTPLATREAVPVGLNSQAPTICSSPPRNRSWIVGSCRPVVVQRSGDQPPVSAVPES